jgi:hypothetical protein
VCTEYYCLGCGRDGLKLPWSHRRIFLNPPYDKSLKDWAEKASERQALVTCMLLPVRTGRPWWQQYVASADLLFFLPGRLTFEGASNNAPFDSALALYWKPLER